MTSFARISVNIPQLTVLFDYEIPASLEGRVLPGSLVTIPFGRQPVQGIVVDLVEEPAVPDTKAIESLLDDLPAILPYQLQFARQMAEDNMVSLSQCLEIMLPPGLSQHADILLHRENVPLPEGLGALQTRLLRILEKRGDLRGRQIDAAMPRIEWRGVLPALIRQGLVSSRSILPPPTVRPKVLRTAQFCASPEQLSLQANAIGRPGTAAFERRLAVLEFLKDKAIPVNVSWAYAESGANSADLSRLAELGLIRLGETEIWRDPLEKLKPVLTQPPTLTADQSFAWEQLVPQLQNPSLQVPNLLVGVTGSGKTELYLRAAAEVLAQGKGVFILVPEISLTPQTVKRFFARFPGQVGLVHSKLSSGERYDTWRRIRSGSLPVVIGARSALFSPLPDPGLIIIDEAHETSYRQEDTPPYYHAISAALSLAEITRSVLLLGSATPGVELLHKFETQRWNVIRLPNRILGQISPAQRDISLTPPVYTEMPQIEVVDMRQELIHGNRSPLSQTLRESLSDVLERHEQAILFLNRRGSASYVFCRDCGFVLRCPRCDTPLTFHSDESALICHSCNYRRLLPKKCPSCGRPNIRQFGLGTESLETLINKDFPAARVLRWDADTARYKGAHDLIMDHFTQHRGDILIGTQMLAKGLDLPLVTLVGVVLADVTLNLPDFRAAERTYQLLTQVAGRAGRSGLGGKAVLQTYQPDHYAIRYAATYDAEGFYRAELAWRERAGYPPFSRLLKIEFRHSDALTAQKAALSAAEQLTQWINEEKYYATSLIGPVPCFYAKRAGYYRWQILLRSPDPRMLLRAHPLTSWQPGGLQVDLVLDPLNLL